MEGIDKTSLTAALLKEKNTKNPEAFPFFEGVFTDFSAILLTYQSLGWQSQARYISFDVFF